ncbi:MAG: hypothetical protein ABSF91_08555 [Bacteroidota bacterium]|jgi:hypothetical protein
MDWSRYFALAAFFVCLTSLSYHFVRLIRLGLPKDYSRRSGNVKSAIAYSFTGAMNPAKKESAFLHLPTYAAGLLYHLGTFVSTILFFLFFFNFNPDTSIRWALAGVLTLSGVSGIGIFLKRLTTHKLRSLSSPDDYVSNFLVTIFQVSALSVLVGEAPSQLYFVCAGILLLYLPIGKLKHALYFFAARYQLGYFYGWRGVWPGKGHG